MNKLSSIHSYFSKEDDADEASSEREDLGTKLLKTRSVVISNQIDSKMADKIIKQLFVLEMEDPEKEIHVYLNTPGGEVFSGFAIFDVLKMITCPITTIVIGCAASMGTILMLAADKGKRLALPHAKIMIHQPLLMGASGQATDLEIRNKEILKTRELLAELYSEKTGKKVKDILKDIDRDYWLTSQEAVEYGLLDRIVTSRDEINA